MLNLKRQVILKHLYNQDTEQNPHNANLDVVWQLFPRYYKCTNVCIV